jgi:hypothetical protein
MKPRHLLSLLVLTSLLLTASPAWAADGDLAISNGDLNFSTSSYLEGHTIRIWATIHNNSASDLLGTVHFTANGAQIGSDQPISALAGKTDDVFVDWVPSSYGSYTIKATIEPWDNNADNPNNNDATKSLYVDQDTDFDGYANSVDQDDDGDGTGDVIDAFPLNNKETTDTDGDGTGDNEDTDDDNDGTLDIADAFPLDPNFTADTDKDGTPDESDEDIDGEGLTNDEEDDLGTDPTLTDTDGDKVDDKNDPFPTDPTEWSDVDQDGEGDNQDEDIDGDGLDNTTDSDPSNPAPIAEVDQNVVIANVGDTVTFDASQSSDDAGIVKYVWQFGNGETVEGPTATRTFDSKGFQTATLTVFDQNGQSDETTVNVHVFDYAFVLEAMSFALLLLLLAFYLVYRYNRRALRAEKAKIASKAPVKRTSKKKK